jgi:serine/threonine-protein kinase
MSPEAHEPRAAGDGGGSVPSGESRPANDVTTRELAPPPAPPRIARYEVRAELGRGGFGRVLRCYDPVLDRDVAVKVLHPEAAGSSLDAEGLLREARAAARLQHPNIVPVHEVGNHEGACFIVMELIDGETLERAASREAVSPRRAAEIVRDLARAADVVHRAGIVHRDIKPGNVLLGPDGRPRLTDFGLARDSRGETLSRAGEWKGTPAYMAPEQLAGDPAKLGPAVDIYALGAVLYRLLAGRPPFLAETPLHLQRAVVSEAPTPPRTLRRAVPLELEAIALRCLKKEPEQRWKSGEALAEALDRFLAGAKVPTDPVPRAPPRSRAASAIAGVLALGAVVAAALAARRTPGGDGSELRVSVVPIVHTAVPRAGAPAYQVGVGRRPAVRAGDGIRFEVTLDRPAHIYLFNVDGSGKMYCLFPTLYEQFYRELAPLPDAALLRNPVRAGRAVIPTPIPGHGPDAWFRFDDTPGPERYFLFAANAPIPELEALATLRAGGDPADARRALERQVELTRGSYQIETGTAPAEIRLDEAPDQVMNGLRIELRGKVAVWDYALDHVRANAP